MSDKEAKKLVRLFEANCREIRRVYGKRRADRANIGWGQADDSVASKVYGNPCMVVQTVRMRRGKRTRFVHTHIRY